MKEMMRNSKAPLKCGVVAGFLSLCLVLCCGLFHTALCMHIYTLITK